MASAIQIVERCRRGDSEAFAELVAAHQDAVYAVAFCNTGDPGLSEDITQETFLQAWRSLHSLRDARRVRAWLCGVARNLSRNSQRKRSRETVSAEVDGIDDRPDPRDAAMTIEAQRIVWAALKDLSVPHREALFLYYQMGKSAREVAETLNVSEQVVLQRLHRGRRELKKEVFRRVEGGLAKLRPTAALSGAVMAAVASIQPGTAAATTHASVEAEGATCMTTTTKILAATAAAAIAGIIVWATVANTGKGATANASNTNQNSTATADEQPVPFATKSRPALAKKKLAAPGIAGDSDRPKPRLADGKRAYKPKKMPPVDPALFRSLRLDKGPARGTPKAPITLIVFTDFHCRFCGNVLGTIDQLLLEYKGKVRVVSKMFPVKAGSLELAKAVTAADEQGKFFEMTNLLYANQDKAMPDKKQLVAYAKQLGLDVAKFARAYDSDAVKRNVEEQIQAGKKIGVRGTPTVFVNGKRIMGAQPIANFRRVIDEKLKALKALNEG